MDGYDTFKSIRNKLKTKENQSKKRLSIGEKRYRAEKAGRETRFEYTLFLTFLSF